ncbi:MAG: bifunctional folylpolyglutamate synthase/dihydrofolate synthase, partial [Bacteroidales bacterium]|nr:bifunctional folylpolyglutamate synthase/dihydrofolate synthase [Bacteroidales bacterium]
VPVVVGESDPRTNPVFLDKAEQMEAPIILASNKLSASSGQITPEGMQLFNVFCCGEPVYRGIKCAQLGAYQQKNIVTAIAAIEQLRKQGLNISDDNVFRGFENVNKNTGFFGRWQVLDNKPLVVCDTGHNPAGITYVSQQLLSQPCRQLRMVIGFVQDKDISSILKLMPKNALYYFVNADSHRALPAAELRDMAQRYELSGNVYSSVAEGFAAAKKDAADDDFIFVGGSNYVVAEIL